MSVRSVNEIQNNRTFLQHLGYSFRFSLFADAVLAKVQEAWKLGVTSLIQLKGGLMNDDGFLVRAASHIKQLVKNETPQTCAR